MRRHAGVFGGYHGPATGFETPHIKQRMTSYECQRLRKTDLKVQAEPGHAILVCLLG